MFRLSNWRAARIPPLRTVVADGNAQRLLLPDHHEQLLAPRDPRVDQVPLQKHVVLRGERNHHCRELRPLRLMDRDCISQRHFVQFAEVVLYYPVIEADGSVDQTTELGWAQMPRGRELNR